MLARSEPQPPTGQPATAAAGGQPTGRIALNQGKEGALLRRRRGQRPTEPAATRHPDLQLLEVKPQQGAAPLQHTGPLKAQLNRPQTHGIAEPKLLPRLADLQLSPQPTQDLPGKLSGPAAPLRPDQIELPATDQGCGIQPAALAPHPALFLQQGFSTGHHHVTGLHHVLAAKASAWWLLSGLP